MKIGIDIDDTVCKTAEEIDIWAKIYTETVLKRNFTLKEGKIESPYWAKELYSWSEEEDKQFWDLYYEEIMINVEPKEDVVEIINNLYQKHSIIFITARWDREEKVMDKITRQWLKKHHIPYHKIYIGYLDKRNVVKENEIELFIDDNVKTCREISKMQVKTMLMHSRLNSQIEDINATRVFSWKDIASKIEEEI